MHGRVMSEYEMSRLSNASRRPERPAAESAVFAALRTDVAAALQAQSQQIGARWAEQVRTVALREAGTGDSLAETATALVSSLAAALASDGSTSDDLVVRGLSFGAEAFELGGSLHHVLKSLDLLSAMLEAASKRVRPMLMTVMTNVFGLLPILLDTGVGSDVAKRIAAPLWGGLLSLTLLTLAVIPALYVIWRERGLPRAAS